MHDIQRLSLCQIVCSNLKTSFILLQLQEYLCCKDLKIHKTNYANN